MPDRYLGYMLLLIHIDTLISEVDVHLYLLHAYKIYPRGLGQESG